MAGCRGRRSRALTLHDNFEWVFDYDFHYGLHTVDRQSFPHGKGQRCRHAPIATAHAVG